MKKLKTIKWIFFGISAAMLILGLCLIINPSISATVLCYLFAVIMIAAGIARIICYTKHKTLGFINYELTQGLLDILLAIIFFLHPHNVITVLPIIIGTMIVINSAFKLQIAIDFKRIGVQNWWSILLLVVLSIIFAVTLILNPYEGSMVLMIFIGISLIIDSIQNIFTIFYISKYIRKIKPIEIDYVEIN